ncbi:YfjI family protein [Variovorax terrae]|uniref:YfjI family protein n=1 Tax=Variovorax terrae TaxID=2923278 RepID=A0A9X1W1R6_9BURK|nr:YfjI family protein [Variovorax terrae]MCJ0764558.1 YfjI family protein [Variovorax terrae]
MSTYPTTAFPRAVREAIEQVVLNVQAPVPLVAMSFLAAMSSAAQHRIKVQLPVGSQPKPVSLFILAVAESGERKTTVDNLVCKPLYELDEAAETEHKTALAAHAHQRALWDNVQSALMRRVVSAVCDGAAPSDDATRKLEAHRETEPVRPRLRRLIRQDASERAILDALEGQGESFSIMGDEGEILLRSPLLRANGVLNKMWDGGPVVLDRANGVSFTARDTRVTVSLMVQNAVLQAYLSKRGGIARGSGFWARFLVSAPQSTQGVRFLYNTAPPAWEKLEAFHALLRQTLASSERDVDSASDNLVYEFDDDAKATWIEFVNRVEADIRPYHYLSDIHDFASKTGELVGRVAALLHCFGQQSGKISTDTVQRALSIVGFHVEEFKRIFSPQYEVPQVQADSQTLITYLHRTCWLRGVTWVPRNEVLRSGPVRDKGRLHTALDALAYERKIWTTLGPAKKRFLNLEPAFFNSLPVM